MFGRSRSPPPDHGLALDLRLGSELVYNGDLGATEPGPASKRYGVELDELLQPPRGWCSTATCRGPARFTDYSPDGNDVPESVGVVVSAGASVDNFHRTFGSARLRYFGPRALVEDNSVQSQATRLVNMQGGYKLTRNVRLTADVFNVFNAQVSDIDYYFASRLPGEPLAGIEDIHFHPPCRARYASAWSSGSDGSDLGIRTTPR